MKIYSVYKDGKNYKILIEENENIYETNATYIPDKCYLIHVNPKSLIKDSNLYLMEKGKNEIVSIVSSFLEEMEKGIYSETKTHFSHLNPMFPKVEYKDYWAFNDSIYPYENFDESFETKELRDRRFYNKQRKDVLSWDEYFMSLAKLTALRSKDPNTQVGACIVDKDKRILSTGYNGSPLGIEDELFPWDRTGNELHTKYMYVCHAELNAILNYRGSRKDLEGSTIYVDLFPCNECAKAIIQSGIRKVIYLSDKYNNTPGNIASKRLFDLAGVKYEEYKDTKTETITLSLKKDK